jgi:hypothetical protein
MNSLLEIGRGDWPLRALGHTGRQRKIDLLSVGRKVGIHAPFGKEQKHHQKKQFQYGYTLPCLVLPYQRMSG